MTTPPNPPTSPNLSPAPPRPAASDSLIGLIQPYVDDELPPAERARVEVVLAEDPVLRDIVEEQRSVRQVLRDMPRETAPQALHARVLLELDAVDREQAPAAPVVPAWRRLRAFFRGAAVMVPAGATAFALFLAARTGLERPAAQADPPAVALASAPILRGSAPDPSPGVRLVAASVGSPDLADPPTRLVELHVGPRRVLDRQEPAGGPPPGPSREHRGGRYWLGQRDGQPALTFEADGVRHTLTRLGPGFGDEREYMFLLSLGHVLRTAPGETLPLDDPR